MFKYRTFNLFQVKLLNIFRHLIFFWMVQRTSFAIVILTLSKYKTPCRFDDLLIIDAYINHKDIDLPYFSLHSLFGLFMKNQLRSWRKKGIQGVIMWKIYAKIKQQWIENNSSSQFCWISYNSFLQFFRN